MRTPLAFWWIGAQGPAGTARRTREIEWPRIHATVDGGRLAMVGLIRHQGLNPFKLTESHQVLAYAAEASGETVSLRLYDPNWPDRDDIAVTADASGIRQSSGETLFGFFQI